MTAENKHYFPPIYGEVDCSRCEAADCWCRGKYQRDRRDFTHTSGRCPRLPDLCGFVEQAERNAYAAAFMLVHAELGLNGLYLTLTIPEQKRSRKVYRTKSGYWYFKTKHEEYGCPIKEGLNIPGFYNEDDIIHHMETLHTEYCILRCELGGFTV